MAAVNLSLFWALKDIFLHSHLSPKLNHHFKMVHTHLIFTQFKVSINIKHFTPMKLSSPNQSWSIKISLNLFKK